MYKVVVDNTNEFTFDGNDGFRQAIRTDLRYTTGMAHDGLSQHDTKFYVDGELLSHTKVGDRVKGSE